MRDQDRGTYRSPYGQLRPRAGATAGAVTKGSDPDGEAEGNTRPGPRRHCEGIGELKVGNGSSRVVVGGKTLAYLKATRIAVRAAHVKRLPKKLGVAVPESNGTWANVAVDSTDKARAIVEYVVAQVQS